MGEVTVSSELANLDRTMSRPKPPSETVRIDSELMEKVRFICFHRRDSSGDRLTHGAYIDPIIRQRIEQDYEEILQEVEEAARKSAAARKKPPRPKA